MGQCGKDRVHGRTEGQQIGGLATLSIDRYVHKRSRHIRTERIVQSVVIRFVTGQDMGFALQLKNHYEIYNGLSDLGSDRTTIIIKLRVAA